MSDRLSVEQLDEWERLAFSAGLIKVFDGREWLDLRTVVRKIIVGLRVAYEQIDTLDAELGRRDSEIARLLDALDVAHAEVTMLGQLLRGDEA